NPSSLLPLTRMLSVACGYLAGVHEKRRPLGPPFEFAIRHASSGERHRDEPGRLGALHLQQHAALAGRLGLRQLGADLADIGDGLAADIEDDVAGLDAALRCRSLRIDFGDHNALLSGSLDFAGRRQAEAETRRTGGLLHLAAVSVSLPLVRQLAEGERHRLAVALVDDVELHRGPR